MNTIGVGRPCRSNTKLLFVPSARLPVSKSSAHSSTSNESRGKEMKWECVERHTRSSPTSPRRLARFSRRVWRGYWQVFGLAGVAGHTDRSFYWPIFPVSEKTSGIWAFDPAYRCGAVPDSHRVLFRRPPVWERRQQTSLKIEGCLRPVNPNDAASLRSAMALN